jgi:hypothetical protein
LILLLISSKRVFKPFFGLNSLSRISSPHSQGSRGFSPWRVRRRISFTDGNEPHQACTYQTYDGQTPSTVGFTKPNNLDLGNIPEKQQATGLCSLQEYSTGRNMHTSHSPKVVFSRMSARTTAMSLDALASFRALSPACGWGWGAYRECLERKYPRGRFGPAAPSSLQMVPSDIPEPGPKPTHLNPTQTHI